MRPCLLRASLGAAVFGSACAWAQVPVIDPAPFRKPLVFMPPQVPGVALADRSEQKYAVELAITTSGTVSAVARIEPDHAEFREQLGKVTKFWLFFPSLDPDTCQPVPSTARIGVEFNGSGDDGTRTWLQYDPMMRVLKGERPVVLKMPAPPAYPRTEAREGKIAMVYTVSVIDGQGKVTQAWTLLESAYSRGFVSTAQNHALSVPYNTSERAMRCAVTVYDFLLR